MLALDTDVLVHWSMRGAPFHEATRRLIGREVRENGGRIALAPQVCWEFLHVATDPRRFAVPFTMEAAQERVRLLWSAPEVVCLHPGPRLVTRTLDLLAAHRLGRKRILDTALAATLDLEGVRRLATLNGADFQVYGLFEIVSPRA